MNESIKTYISGMFTGLPQNDQVTRAENELLEMAGDKYAELRTDGLSDSDATGRVITEFGNLDDLADMLGIRDQLGDTAGDTPLMPEAEVDAAVTKARRGHFMIATGVALIILGIAANSVLSEVPLLSFNVEASSEKTQASIESALGGPIMLTVIFIAVALFMIASMVFTKPMGPIHEREVRVGSAVAAKYRRRVEQYHTRYVTGLVSGVGLIGLSIILTAWLQVPQNTEAESDGMIVAASVPANAIMLAMIAVAVAILIIVSNHRSTLNAVERAGRALTNTERAERAADSKIGVVAAIYWPTVTAIYLAWSFIFEAWGISWVIWPVAGVLFGGVAALTCELATRRTKNA